MRSAVHAPFFYVHHPVSAEATLYLAGNDALHLAKVRRAGAGDSVRLSNGRGMLYESEVVSVETARVGLRIRNESMVERPSPEITVLQGIPQSKKADFLIQKLVELGVDSIGLFEAVRTTQRWGKEKMAAARTRWQKMALEASKQSHRAWLPKVEGPISTDDAVAISGSCELSMVMEPIAAQAFRGVLRGRTPATVCLTVGPEGGLADDELTAFEKRGAARTTLGAQVLRTETAGLVAAAVAMYEFGRLGG